MFRKYLITGLLIWLPLGITLLILQTIIGWMDQSMLLLPPAWRPEALVGFRIPGLGALLAIAVVFFTGVLARNIVGRRLLLWWEGLLGPDPDRAVDLLEREAGVRHDAVAEGQCISQGRARRVSAAGAMDAGVHRRRADRAWLRTSWA